jgi:hypothetical protein
VHTGKAGGTWLICGLSELRMTELDGDVWGAVHGGMSESVFCCVEGLFRGAVIYFRLVEDFVWTVWDAVWGRE